MFLKKMGFVGLVICLVGSCLLDPALAQDVVFMQEAPRWFSPVFETTRDTRIEWSAEALGDAENPTFSFKVVEEGSEAIVKEETGMTGMSFLDIALRVYLQVSTEGVRIWEIRLFNLATPPATTTIETTAPSETNPETQAPAEVLTITQTVAVYETLPPQSWLVQLTFFTFGALGALVSICLVVLVLIRKNVNIVLVPEEKEEILAQTQDDA